MPARAFAEIGLTMALGLLLDAFVVRTVLVPAVITLVGAVSRWPERALRAASGA